MVNIQRLCTVWTNTLHLILPVWTSLGKVSLGIRLPDSITGQSALSHIDPKTKGVSFGRMEFPVQISMWMWPLSEAHL